jgi:hypothetical protein
MFGIVSTGPSSIAIDMTYDRKRLDEAINKIAGNGLKPSDIIGGAEGAEAQRSAVPRARGLLDRGRHRPELERVQNRRKAVVYVSNGYDFNPFVNARLETIRSTKPRRSVGRTRRKTSTIPRAARATSLPMPTSRELSELTVRPTGPMPASNDRPARPRGRPRPRRERGSGRVERPRPQDAGQLASSPSRPAASRS